MLIYCALVAVQRMYEKLRRQYLKETPERAQRAQYLDLKKKFHSRKERVIYIIKLALYTLILCSCLPDGQSTFQTSIAESGMH